jgi:excisionase family DNA binding protein
MAGATRADDLAAVATRTTITIEEAASLLGIGRTAAYEAARRGQLPTRRLGRRLLVPVPALLDWLGRPSSTDQGLSKDRQTGAGVTQHE